MVCAHLIANEFMSALPIYTPQESTLACVISKIEQYKLSKITITDSDFATIATVSKRDIAKFLLEKNIRKNDPLTNEIQIKELLNPSQSIVVAYPTTRISEIYDAMLVLKIDYIPIVKTPWHKVLIGFISFEKIQEIIDEAAFKKMRI